MNLNSTVQKLSYRIYGGVPGFSRFFTEPFSFRHEKYYRLLLCGYASSAED
jgi:hypothetical protein